MSRLWSITCFFNPIGYRSKLLNYKIFRNRLRAPLLTVEHSRAGRFELGSADADILVQVSGGDLMWQKERLLNLAVSRLPEHCELVAWLDCDVVFAKEDWTDAASVALENSDLCQLYRRVYHLRPETPEDQIGRDAATLFHDSAGWAIASHCGTPVASVTDAATNVFKRGHAWCARRRLLLDHGLYDRNILGSGDRMVFHAATGQTEELIAYSRMGHRHAEHYRRWAEPFRAAASRISYLDNDLFHLWHGDLARRRYSQRQHILSALEYDPDADIALTESECWRWNSPKYQLHRLVREYFEQRREDLETVGAPREPSDNRQTDFE